MNFRPRGEIRSGDELPPGGEIPAGVNEISRRDYAETGLLLSASLSANGTKKFRGDT